MEFLGVVATILMFAVSGVTKLVNPAQDVPRLLKLFNLPINILLRVLQVVGFVEVLASSFILKDVSEDGKLGKESIKWIQYVLIPFTILVTFLFYLNPNEGIKVRPALSNLSTLGSLLLMSELIKR